MNGKTNDPADPFIEAAIADRLDDVADSNVEQLGGILVGEMAGLPSPASNDAAIAAEGQSAADEIAELASMHSTAEDDMWWLGRWYLWCEQL